MRRLKKILDSWNVLRHRMRNQDEAQEVKGETIFSYNRHYRSNSRRLLWGQFMSLIL